MERDQITITFESDALAEAFDLDECPTVEIEIETKMYREVAYDTPFGRSYSWSKETKIESVWYQYIHKTSEAEASMKSGLITSSIIDSMPLFKKEIERQISRFENRIV